MGDQPLNMSKHRLNIWVQSAVLLAVVTMAATFAAGQQQPLPDAPKPQNNAPAPSADVTAPVPGMSDASGTGAPSKDNPQSPPNTRSGGDQPQSGPLNPEAPLPGSQGIKTVPPGTISNAPGNDFDELFKLQVQVNFITVPVTVKDPEGKMVDGLLATDFSVYEDNVKQTVTFFTSDPFPLSAAVVIGAPEMISGAA